MTFYQIIMHSQMQVLLSMLEFWYLILSVVLSKIKLNDIKGSVAGFGKCKICKLFTPLTDCVCSLQNTNNSTQTLFLPYSNF